MITVLSIALITLFLHACTWDGMILEVVHAVLQDLPVFLKKPLYDCPICMTIWWGPTIAGIGVVGNLWVIANTWQLFLYVVTAAGLNVILSMLVNYLRGNVKRKCNCERKARLQIQTE
jgi:hypothetical protein